MTVVDITPALASRYAVPVSCTEILNSALNRIVQDGMSALCGNPLALPSMVQDLQQCQKCIPSGGPCLRVVNGDDWEAAVHPKNLANSIDVGLLVDAHGRHAILPVEGKLGMACDYPGDRGGSTIRLVEMEAKVEGMRALLPSSLQMSGSLIIVVPKNGKEWAWYSVRRWNLAGNRIGRLFSCCIDDFLLLVGATSSNSRPGTCVSTFNAFRSRLLVEEFSQPGPMSRVQLPQAGICIGCRKCREACPRTAIALIPDNQGRLYPFVDKKSCKTGCRHCESVCPILARGRAAKC